MDFVTNWWHKITRLTVILLLQVQQIHCIYNNIFKAYYKTYKNSESLNATAELFKVCETHSYFHGIYLFIFYDNNNNNNGFLIKPWT